jgi:hypothetical protein
MRGTLDAATCERHVPTGRPLWSLREDVHVVADADGSHVTVDVDGHPEWRRVYLRDVEPMLHEALHRMSLGPVSLENVPPLDVAYRNWKHGVGDCGPWQRIRAAFDRLGGCVVASLGTEDVSGPLLSAVATRPDVVFRLPPTVPDRQKVALRTGARLASAGRELGLICADAPFKVFLPRGAAQDVVVHLVLGPCSAEGLAEAAERPLSFVRDVLAYLGGARMLAS